MKKIAIIGAGWIGCHLAQNLKKSNEVYLFDKSGIFSETSHKNQNRLHLGFHYPRNYNTRKLCYDTFDKFISQYRDIVFDVKNNIYCIPKDKSLVDFMTYTNILSYENVCFDSYTLNEIKNIEGAIRCNEKRIDHNKAKEYFRSELNEILQQKTINDDELLLLSNQYDYVINCTNNHIKDKSNNSYYELCLTMLYSKKKNIEFDALTMMDGPFFSIYPYQDNIYTVTDVEYTPVLKTENIITKQDINIKQYIDNIENKIKYFYPNFNNDFEYTDYFLSTKVKKYNQSADRYPVISKEKNIINCYTGKIQGIYIIEDFINETVNR